MKSLVLKRTVAVAGHKTSVSLEDPFWTALKDIASGRHMTLSDLVTEVHANRQHDNLSCALRLFVLGFYRDQIAGRPGGMQSVAEPAVPWVARRRAQALSKPKDGT